MTAIVQGLPQVAAQVPQTPIAQHQSLPKPFFPRMKENAIWAWNVTVEKVQTAGKALKELLQKVIAAIRTYFGPKIEVAKTKARELYDHLAQKFSTPPKTQAPAAAPPKLEPTLERTAPLGQEEPKVLLNALAEPEHFVPYPMVAEHHEPPKPLEVQMPVQAVQEIVIDAPDEKSAQPLVQGPLAQAEPEQVGIFSLWPSWFKWK